MRILAIETSCDETAAAIVEINGQKEKTRLKILSNIVSSQIKIHQKFGGVVPEVAARAHIEEMPLVLSQVFSQAKLNFFNIDLITVTSGPGLATSLLVGVETAKALSYLTHRPLIEANHLRGHIYAAFANYFDNKEKIVNSKIFPGVALIVSGGHTELFLFKNWYTFKKLGQTLDDAAGEYFDKAAKLLNLGYPGGPIISELAAQASTNNNLIGLLPRPMLQNQNFNFSFSGLKTAVLYFLKNKKNKQIIRHKFFINNFCQEIQRAAVDVLVAKTIRAANKFNTHSIILAGGVAANKELRQQLAKSVDKLKAKINFFVPPIEFCTDNALMIALAGYFKWQKISKKQKLPGWQLIKIDPNQEV
jgi:N6-L-threonylcarbamoyladenine synthase